jgi:hypothetical protein
MHNFYRYIGCKIESVLFILENQAELAGCQLIVTEEYDTSDKDRSNIITVITERDVIIDIFRG